LRRIFGSTLGLRVDMGSFEGNGLSMPYPIFDIKSCLEIPEGMAQIDEYLTSLWLAAPDVVFSAGAPENWPDQPGVIMVNGYTVYLFKPVYGVISYYSPDHAAQSAMSIAGFAAAMYTISNMSSQAALGEIIGEEALAFAIAPF